MKQLFTYSNNDEAARHTNVLPQPSIESKEGDKGTLEYIL